MWAQPLFLSQGKERQSLPDNPTVSFVPREESEEKGGLPGISSGRDGYSSHHTELGKDEDEEGNRNH